MKKEICCNNEKCSKFKDYGGTRDWITHFGFYRRQCDSKVIQRFRCVKCGKTFSNQTFNLTFGQHKPRINKIVRQILCSKISFRRAAKVLQVNRKTVVKKFKFHAEIARERQKHRLAKLSNLDFIQIDEMETFEHSKCKPVSIAIAVVPGTRIILGALASEMPAKGTLAKISRQKYGLRRDDRKREFQNLLQSSFFFIFWSPCWRAFHGRRVRSLK